MSLLEEGCPQPLTCRHVSLLLPDNDLPCRSRGLPGDAGFSVTVVEASRENLQRCDCSRYQGKTTATPPTPPTPMQTRVLTSTCKTGCMCMSFSSIPPFSLPGNCPHIPTSPRGTGGVSGFSRAWPLLSLEGPPHITPRAAPEQPSPAEIKAGLRESLSFPFCCAGLLSHQTEVKRGCLELGCLVAAEGAP